jgi:hypothetical protein
MGIPVNDEYVRNRRISLQIEEMKREVELRTQEDYRVFISYSHLDRDVTKHKGGCRADQASDGWHMGQ